VFALCGLGRPKDAKPGRNQQDTGMISIFSHTDSRNLLTWLVNPQNERTTWVYDVLRRVMMTYANTAIAETGYDAGGRISVVRNLKSDRSVISIFTYSYDNAGSRTAVGEADGDLVTWSYDEIYQLTREQRSGSVQERYDVTYTYDEVGNRLARVEGRTRTTYSYSLVSQERILGFSWLPA
jgi:uncharacterized protein RhaS with RHS repeats